MLAWVTTTTARQACKCLGNRLRYIRSTTSGVDTRALDRSVYHDSNAAPCPKILSMYVDMNCNNLLLWHARTSKVAEVRTRASGLHVVVSGMCMFYEIGPVFFRTTRYAL